ncbi:hypothetical protein ABZP36_003182 [Zizania latifolia]
MTGKRPANHCLASKWHPVAWLKIDELEITDKATVNPQSNRMQQSCSEIYFLAFFIRADSGLCWQQSAVRRTTHFISISLDLMIATFELLILQKKSFALLLMVVCFLLQTLLGRGDLSRCS